MKSTIYLIYSFINNRKYEIVYDYFFLYGIFSFPLIIEELDHFNFFSSNWFIAPLFGLSIFISSKVIESVSHINQESTSLYSFLINILRSEGIKKLHIAVFFFGIFWFLHNKYENYMSEKVVKGEALIIDSNKLCDWHLSLLVKKFKRGTRVFGETVSEVGNGFNEINYSSLDEIRNGSFQSFYFVKYKEFETESIEDSGPYGSGYNNTETITGTKEDLKSRFWKIQNGLFIEGGGIYFEKY